MRSFRETIARELFRRGPLGARRADNLRRRSRRATAALAGGAADGWGSLTRRPRPLAIHVGRGSTDAELLST